MSLEVGQKLWFVPHYFSYLNQKERDHRDREVTVVRIGRKWADVGDGLRIDRQTLWADGKGYPSPGRCYRSAEAYRKELARNELWNKFASRISLLCQSPPARVTTETIKHVTELLGISLEDDR